MYLQYSLGGRSRDKNQRDRLHCLPDECSFKSQRGVTLSISEEEEEYVAISEAVKKSISSIMCSKIL
jgi:hypothetical protein